MHLTRVQYKLPSKPIIKPEKKYQRESLTESQNQTNPPKRPRVQQKHELNSTILL